MMNKRNLLMGAGVGATLTAPLIAIQILLNQLVGLPNVPFELFDWIARVTPGPLITFGIDLMIDSMRFLNIDVADSAKTAERIMAVIQFFVGGIVLSALFFGLWSRLKRHANIASMILLGVVFGGPLIAISLFISQSPINVIWRFLYLDVSFFLWAVLVNIAYQRLIHVGETEFAAPAPPMADAVPASTPAATTGHAKPINRRQFLVGLGASTATVTVIGAAVSGSLAAAERREREAELAAVLDESGQQTAVAGTGMPLPNLNDPVIPAFGTRPEYTPLQDHYKVFINTEPSIVEGATWTLPITGLVDNPLELTLDDLRNNYEKVERFNTITCISGRVGTGLIGTTFWGGLRLSDLLADVGVQANARYLIITSADGFYETLDLKVLKEEPRIMLAYEWDGKPLPEDHGFPLRIWIPDRYGMKQPKWITGFEFVEEYVDGYWVERNWDKEAIVKSSSVIDTVAVNHLFETQGQKYIPVGGTAYAGVRGVSKVEVRIDDGPWNEAEMRQPLSDSTWAIWRWDMPYQEGDLNFYVRLVEGDGTPQISERQGNRPDGASGYHTRDVEVKGLSG